MMPMIIDTIKPTEIKRLIGITGGIGAGKSVVSRLLRLKGYKVYDCDSEAKKLMNKPEAKSLIKSYFGESVLDDEGNINRAALAEKLFEDPIKLKEMEAIVHPLVKKNLLGVFQQEVYGNILFVESAILSSSGLAELCDEIWYVDAKTETRLSRTKKRDNISEAHILKRIKAQANELRILEKLTKPIKIIDNNTENSLIRQIFKSHSGNE